MGEGAGGEGGWWRLHTDLEGNRGKRFIPSTASFLLKEMRDVNANSEVICTSSRKSHSKSLRSGRFHQPTNNRS